MNIILLCRLTFTVLINRMINRYSHAFEYNFGTIVHVTLKLNSATPRAITQLLLLQLFPNCTQMGAITYTYYTGQRV